MKGVAKKGFSFQKENYLVGENRLSSGSIIKYSLERVDKRELQSRLIRGVGKKRPEKERCRDRMERKGLCG